MTVPLTKRPGASQFDPDPTKHQHGFLTRAWQKLRYAMRTGRDPDTLPADLDAPTERIDSGGINEENFGEWT